MSNQSGDKSGNQKGKSANNFVFYRDLVIPESEWNGTAFNRAFRYGDALFETVRICKGKPLFFMHHYSRLILGMETLRLDIPEFWQPEFFRKGIRDLAKMAEIPDGRLRITVWRDGQGKYQPQTNSVDLLMEIEPLDMTFYGWSKG
ncbi:MAG: branched-chain amino acid aminotransferase, partial [Limisphaerales bacterium]